MQENFEVANVKCGGCAAAIRDGLHQLPGVQSVDVDIATGQVKVAGDVERQQLAAKLAELGYPEKTEA